MTEKYGVPGLSKKRPCETAEDPFLEPTVTITADYDQVCLLLFGDDEQLIGSGPFFASATTMTSASMP